MKRKGVKYLNITPFTEYNRVNRLDLSVNEAKVLAVIVHRVYSLSTVHQQTVAWSLGISRPTVSNMLKSLCKKDIINLKLSQKDGDSVCNIYSPGSKYRDYVLVEPADDEFILNLTDAYGNSIVD